MKRLAGVWSWGLPWLLAELLPAQFESTITLVGVPAAGVAFAAPFGLVVVRQWSVGWMPQAFDEAALAPLAVELVDSSVNHAGGGFWSERREYRARATAVGELPEQSITLRWQGSTGEISTTTLRRPALRVGSILPTPPGELEWAGSVRDLPGPRRWLWAVLALVAGTLGIGWFVMRGRRRPLPAAGLEVGAAAVGPEVAALEALAGLRLPDDVAASEQVAVFYAELKQVVRDYAARRFVVPAFVRSSEELLALMPAGRAPLGECFSACDGVLFGARRPVTSAHEAARAAAATFVREAAVAASPPSSARSA